MDKAQPSKQVALSPGSLSDCVSLPCPPLPALPSSSLPSPPLPSVRPFTFWNDSRRDEHSVSWGARHPAASNHLPYCVCFRIIFQK